MSWDSLFEFLWNQGKSGDEEMERLWNQEERLDREERRANKLERRAKKEMVRRIILKVVRKRREEEEGRREVARRIIAKVVRRKFEEGWREEWEEERRGRYRRVGIPLFPPGWEEEPW